MNDLEQEIENDKSYTQHADEKQRSPRLIHYSSTSLNEIRSVSQFKNFPNKKLNSRNSGPKPSGLWVSVEGEDDWEKWRRSESFGIESLTHQSEIILKDKANILRLANASQILAFDEKFRMLDHEKWDARINWGDVASQYQGIIIAPYCWSLRLEDSVFWYYGWDCASGCIWDASAVAEVREFTLETK